MNSSILRYQCPECGYVGNDFEFSGGRPACYMDCPNCNREVRPIPRENDK